MKLVFPGGEHSPHLLEEGVTRIGSDPECGIRLEQPGALPRHCELQVTGARVLLQVMPDAAVSVNARPVQGLIALRPGDQLDIAGVQVRLAAMPAPVVARNREVAPAVNSQGSVEDAGLTRVRPVLPRFVLRGVSGSMLGRSHPLVGVATVGRAPECTLQIEDAGLSRQHARLVPVADGVQVEDAGSTNGTFLNGITRQRVISLLRQAGVTVHETTLSIQDFREADEIFSSGNMSKVVPITAFDDRKLEFGPLAKKARALYWEWAHA